jgi:hypothetical protein
MELENKSYRGMLIEVIVKSFIKDYAFDSKDGLKEILQDKLNLNLNFETSISEVEEKNGFTYGGIYFKDEDGTPRVVDFTIMRTGLIA